jgi:SAM-dependent methyltransferase
MADVLQDYRTVWDRKPVLRLVYNDFYERIADACASGMTIEIGGGIGNLKQRLNDVVATDIQFESGLDCVADAQYLPFATGIAANIVMVDVLHHIEFPIVFFREVERVLRSDGRLIMVEPAITWGSTLFIGCCTKSPFEPRPILSSRACPIRIAIPMIPTRRSRHCSRRATASASIGYFRISR